jgi:1,4-alpha-glucan branching enzyme
MGWMHDTLKYFEQDPIHRKFHHNALCFRQVYAFSENFVLPLSHDEVVHGKGSLLAKMPGDEWQRLANLRLLLGYMFAQPGKKLLFMGSEFGQVREWNHDTSLDWHLTENAGHRGLQRFVRDLNTIYRGQPALYENDCDPAGFEWIDANDADSSVLSFLRRGKSASDDIIVVCNFTPLTRYNYKVGAPQGGYWEEILNSDATLYGGSGQGNMGGVTAAPLPRYGRPYLLNVTAPPLGMALFRRQQARDTS